MNKRDASSQNMKLCFVMS